MATAVPRGTVAAGPGLGGPGDAGLLSAPLIWVPVRLAAGARRS